ncbi:MAG: hypothetical protein ACYC37_00460 [Desulfobacteria bacterium]
MNVLLVNPPTPAHMPNKEFIFSTALLPTASSGENGAKREAEGLVTGRR